MPIYFGLGIPADRTILYGKQLQFPPLFGLLGAPNIEPLD